jgi:ABC-2 type transport system permease protein
LGGDAAMKGALWVCERDLRKFVRQPFVMISALVAPFLMLILLGNAFGGSITHVPVAVVRYSQGEYSSAYIDILRTEQSFALGGRVSYGNTFRLIDAPDLESAEQMLRQGNVKAIIYIPSTFDSVLSNDGNGIVTIYLDNTDPLSAQAAAGGFVNAANQVSAQIQTVTVHQPNLEVDTADFYRRVEYIEFMAPGSIVQSIFVASIIGGGISILFDKQRGVIEGYLTTPLKQYEIVVGVLLAGVAKAMFSSLTMLFLAIVIAGVRPMTNAAGFLLMVFTIFLTGLGVISMMTAFAVRAPAPEVYQFSAFPINLVLYFTSGAIYPIEGFPEWMRRITVINPEAYAVHALRLIMYKGADFAAIAGDLAFLAVFTGIMVIIATLAFKRAL